MIILALLQYRFINTLRVSNHLIFTPTLGPSRGSNNFYVYMNHNITKGEVARADNPFKPPSNLLLTVPRRCFCCVFFLIVNVRPFSSCL